MGSESVRVKEEAILFGQWGSLVGIISPPAHDVILNDPPAIILLNAGSVHRAGPNRLSVNIARSLAAYGFPVLRFDYSGIGDSKVRLDNLRFEKSTIQETQEAMDLMAKRTGATQFIVGGLCSGADNAIRVAAQDDRIIGLLLLEAYAFLSYRYYFWVYQKQLFRLNSWLRLVRGSSEVLAILKAKIFKRAESSARSDDDWEEEIKRQLVTSLSLLAGRGVCMCLIYAESGPAYYNYRNCLKRVLGAARRFGNEQVTVIPNSDHLFSSLSHQDLLMRTIADWVLGIQQQ